MARSGDHSLLEQLGKNPLTPRSLLGEIFEKHPGDSVVPMNPSAPPELLRQLAQDHSVFWRARVAMNPNTPADVLRELASDPKVSGALYCNPGAPDELREWSLKHGTFLDPYDPEIGDWDPIDGARCAADATCSHRLLDVDASAWDRPGTSAWWRRWDGWVATVWMNPNLTADQFHRIFGPFGWEDDASIARCLLLRNPRVPPEIIERVAEEEQALPEDEGDPVVRLFTGLAMLAQPDYFSSERAEQLMLLVSRDPIALDIDDPGWDSSRLCHLESNHPSLWTRLMVDPQEWVDAARLDPVTPIPVLRLLTNTEE